MRYTAVIQTPIGKLGIHSTKEYLTRIEFLCDAEHIPLQQSQLPLIQYTIHEIESYFKKRQTHLTIPYQLEGTSFQRKVWQTLTQISPSQTLSYGQLAQQLGSGARAIGNACKQNPLPLLIPCHRVVAKQGFGGFAGDTSGKKLAIKKWLLNHEQVI